MDVEKYLIFIRDQDKTPDIETCTYNNGKWEIKYYGNSTVYPYNAHNVTQYKNPIKIDAQMNTVYHHQQPVLNVKKILQFEQHTRLIFNDCSDKTYENSTLYVEQSSLSNNSTRDTFDYLSALAKSESKPDDEQLSFLGKAYQEMTHIHPKSVLAHYLSGETPNHKEDNQTLIFPFGLNASQKSATEKAFSEQLSIIEGPPGTGKTQTILNIIANAIIRNETVAVVSNNNSATMNVLEKLEQYGFDFLAAYLGNKENQKAFFDHQIETLPSMDNWHLAEQERESIQAQLQQSQLELDEMLQSQNRQAKLTYQLSAFQKEYTYFKDYMGDFNPKKFTFKSISRLNSNQVLQLLIRFMNHFKEGKIKLRHKLYNIIFYGVIDFNLYKLAPETIVTLLQETYYSKVISELEGEIERIKKQLKDYHFEENMNIQSDDSMTLLKDALAKKYDTGKRHTFNPSTFRGNFNKFIKQYPVILSTTHSLRNSSAKDYLFDYVLIDEASQVDIVTGSLALSCAKNAVIVGDQMQLPHVVPKERKKRTEKIFESYHVNEAYNYAEQSLLSSINSLFREVPKTLLKEHYRSHPEIIGFCNQKFYNNELIILTKDSDIEVPLILYETVEGNHARGTINQRQGDVIYNEIIPNQQINPSTHSVGIIAPFRDQADLLQETKTDKMIEADTVHKYQGQEKDIIILSTVSNHIKENDFVDNTNLMNVAISRAVKQLIVVISAGSENWHGTNIGDLVRYVRYNNLEVIESEVRSVFDLLYKSYSKQLLKVMNNNKKVSEYNSENLMNVVIEKILKEPEFQSLHHVLHQPLMMLIRDREKLTEEERTYTMNVLTHTDFVIYDQIDKQPLLVVEVDGHAFHANNPDQLRRDEMKDTILQKYNIPIIRLKTTGSDEETILRNKLKEVMKKQS